MCTALILETQDKNVLFGRNLDWVYNLEQSPVLVPRNFRWYNKVSSEWFSNPYAILGIGDILDKQPLLLDGINEEGLACAALYFPGYAKFNDKKEANKTNIAPLDITYWVLSKFQTVEQVAYALNNVNIVRFPEYGDLHWIVADKSGKSIVIEKTDKGLNVYDNDIRVLTNSPSFDWQTTNLNQYIPITPIQPSDVYWSEQKLSPVGKGLGTLGMPGDYSPPSRFIRAAFAKTNMPVPENEIIGISEFYHILNNVAVVNGSVVTRENLKETTLYSSCMNLQKCIYYYNTYYNNRINAINLLSCDLNSSSIQKFELLTTLDINHQN
ncbi:MAG: choloylglycine hydrolase [Angelakisella sp.]